MFKIIILPNASQSKPGRCAVVPIAVKLRDGNANDGAVWEAVSDGRSKVCGLQSMFPVQPVLVPSRSAPPTFLT
jgi:hypothetical protein